MDYNSANSELLESLDFLRPPVKRIFGGVNKGTSVKLGSHPKPIEFLKDFRKKFSNSTQYPSPKISGAQSSTSLILKRPTDAESLDQYALLNYLSLHSKSNTVCSHILEEKPLIRVTVTPNYIPTANAPRKRKYLAKKIQTTKSNHENSIPSRNVYLVVPGNKIEKVYQIKTTESAKLPSDHSFGHAKDEVIPIEQLSSLQLVLDSLNMENRREKSKKRKQKASPNRENFIKTSEVYDGYSNLRDCTCPNAVQGDTSPDVTPRKSFVRITGHLGLTEDDRYVLRCAATVNDKRVVTNFCGAENDSPISSRRKPRFLALQKDVNSCITQCYNTIACNYSKKRDSNIQTDLQNINSNKEAEKQAAVMLSKESQATQVDFNMDLSLDLKKYKNLNVPFKDEIIQCCCTNDLKSESDSDTNDCQSPLVIISVYPDCCENSRVIEHHQNDEKDFTRRININDKNEIQNFKQRPHSEKINVKDKSKDTRPRSRSPSPIKNQNKSRPVFAETKVRKNSPIREVVATAFPRRQPPINTDGKNGKGSSLERNKERSPRLERRKESQGTNTDHNITKKIIVENYTKKLTAFMNNGNAEKTFSFPKTNPSKIAVNIDGDNEYYDVLFQQGHVTTDLKVKKTIKGSNKKRTADLKDKSLKNNLALPEQLRSRETPQAITRKEQLNDAPSLKNAFARLQVRDSLEISHRHDTKTGQNLNKQASKNSVERSEPFSAPIKHYRGDSCPIPDPMVRDKEIRTLLGIDKGVHTSISRDFEVDKKKLAVPLHYIYNRMCGKKKVSGINLVEMPLLPPCVCCDIKTKYLPGTYKCVCTAKNQQWPSPEPSLAKIPTAISSFQSVNLYTNSSGIYHQDKDKEATSFNVPSSSVVDEVDFIMPNMSKFPRKSTGGNNIGTQYETQVQRTSLYQQLILNRNVQVSVQVEQFSKQKPIILSRKQYDKVKRTIENTKANKTGRDNKRKKIVCKTSLVSVGDVRRKTKTDETLHFDKQNQTDKNVLLMKTTTYSSQSINASLIPKKSLNTSLANHSIKQSRHSVYDEKKKSMNKTTDATKISDSRNKIECECKKPISHTMVQHSKLEIVNDITQQMPVPPRHAVSTMEIRYASMSFMNHVTFSSTNAEAGSTTAPLQEKESHSVHTIFKGRRKCHTPNLGTSVYSLCSEVEPSEKQTPPIAPQESKRKPFLRRLISCLVMRSERASDLNNALLNTPEMLPSVDSSIDSYHINTSLGAIEMTSSIYDTSASFYSNHSVYPVNSKIKRVGFFTSVREFLTSRKS